MNVRELIERLQDCDPDAEVLIASQPQWPMQNEVRGIATSDDLAMEQACEEHEHYNCDDCAAAQGEPVVYIVEGSQCAHPYAPRAAWEIAS